MEFFRQEYWSRLPLPPPGDLPDPGIEPMSLASAALAGGFFTTSATWEAPPFQLKTISNKNMLQKGLGKLDLLIKFLSIITR